MPTSDEKNRKLDTSDIIIGVYYGKYGPYKLPEQLYYATAKVLLKGVNIGLGRTKADFILDAPGEALAKELSENIYMFAAAKTFQQTLEYTDAMVGENGVRRSFADFKEAATEIYTKYNGEDFDGEEMGNWLKTEYDTAIGQARMADKWEEIQKVKADFPNLMYMTSGGENVCEICGPLDKLIAPVDDPCWDDIMPENHFGCDCTVVQLDEDTTEEQGGVDDSEDIKTWMAQSNEKKNPLFNMNPGKDKAIFLDTGRNKHPYFEVSSQYRELAKNNFNLPIPE